MRSDMSALFAVLGASLVVSLIAVGVIALGSFGVLPSQTANYLAIATWALGVIVIALRFGPRIINRK